MQKPRPRAGLNKKVKEALKLARRINEENHVPNRRQIRLLLETLARKHGNISDISEERIVNALEKAGQDYKISRIAMEEADKLEKDHPNLYIRVLWIMARTMTKEEKANHN